MANYDLTKQTLVKHLQTATQKLYDFSANAIRSGKIDGNTVSFYTSPDKSGTAAFSFDFPNELVLDQFKTTFVAKFEYSAEAYPNTENPNLENQPVLVIAVKDTNAKGETSTTYSFLDMKSLVVKISEEANNALVLKNDGLHVDISGKINKVDNPTAGHTVIVKADGTLEDSGHAIASDEEVNAMLDEIFGTTSGE